MKRFIDLTIPVVLVLLTSITSIAHVSAQSNAAADGRDARANDALQSAVGTDVVEGDSDDESITDDGGDRSAGTSLMVTPAGAQRHVPGRWATVAVNGINRTDDDVLETATATVGDNSNVQFARELWIPPHSRRQSWMAVQIPEISLHRQTTIDMRSIHVKQSEGGERFQANVTGMPTSRRSLLLSWEESRAAALLDASETSPEAAALTEKTSNLIYAARDATHASTQELGLAYLSASFLPATAKALDSIDQIVISSDRILRDTAAASRIRTWLHSGGRIWVFADQMDPDAVRELLGNAACYSVIDRVELNDFEIEQIAEYAQLDKNNYATWSSETPVPMARVMVDTEDVPVRVNGWPAAFWKPVGQGEVLFTTLGVDGWLENGEPTLALKTIASRFFVNRVEPPEHTETLMTFLDDQIGYGIPSRISVASVLGGHMLVIGVLGLWLARRRSLQHLAILIPASALIATLVLVAIGNRQTRSVPSTIATAQIAQMSADSSEVQIQSVAAVYSQQGRTLSITSSPETTTTLGEVDTAGSVRRILWDDSGRSRWLFVDQPPGVVRYVKSDSIVTLTQPWTVEGRFSERGFEAHISGLHAGQCEDAVILTPTSPALAVDFAKDSSTRFSSGFDAVMAPGQFIDDKLMSDVQRDRQELLRRLFRSETPIFGRDPTLVAWTRPIESGVSFDDDFTRRGTTLASIPIRFERLPKGARFKVPASFTRLEAHAGARGMSTMFNTETGRWIDELSKPAESELRCQLPKTVLPCQLERATILVKINAPSRTLEIKGLVDEQFVTLHQIENPNGLHRIEIDRPGALKLDPEGGLLIAIAVSQTDEERDAELDDAAAAAMGPSRSTWKIDYLHVHLEGTTH